MQTNVLVDGMTCGHCVSAVTQELNKLDGVSDVEITLGGQEPSRVAIESASELDQDLINAAISEAGYEMVAGE